MAGKHDSCRPSTSFSEKLSNGRNNLSNVKSFIKVRLVEGLTFFNKDDSTNFSGKKKYNEALQVFFFLTIRVKRLIEFRTRSCSPIYRSPLSVSFCLAKTGTRKRAKRTGRGFRGHWSRRFFSDLRALSMLKLPIDSNANVSKQVFKAKELTSLDSKIRTYHNTSLKNTKEVAI